MPVRVITESDTGLAGPIGDEFGIHVLPHYINHGGRSYSDLALDRDELIAWLRAGDEVASAHLTPQEMLDAFREVGKGGDPVLYIPISSRYSKTYDLALSVRKELPGQRIEVIDSARAAGGHAMVALEAARLAQAGKGIDEIVAEMNEIDPLIDEILVIDSLRQLAKEGRVQETEGPIASIIAVKPLVAHRDGLIAPVGKARTNTQALEQITGTIKKSLAQHEGVELRLIVMYGEDAGWAEQVSSRLEEEFAPERIWTIPAPPSTLLRIGPGGWTVAWRVVR